MRFRKLPQGVRVTVAARTGYYVGSFTGTGVALLCEVACFRKPRLGPCRAQLGSCETMRNTVPVAPSQKTPQRIAAGKIIKRLRRQELGLTSQEAYAEHIGASPRQVADAERGEYVGSLTKERIERGFGWQSGDFDRLVAKGEHPPVQPPRRDTAGTPRVVLLTASELATRVAEIEELETEGVLKRGTAQGFLDAAMRIRREWDSNDPNRRGENHKQRDVG